MSDVNTDTGVILEALNDKADRDLNNINPSQTVKETIVGLGMPDYSAMVSKTKGTSYTAEKYGFLIGSDTYGSTGGASAYVYINGVNVRVSSSQDNFSTNSWCYPIAKGSTYSYSGGASMSMYFVPAIGG